MAQPTPYNPAYDFSDFQTSNPTTPLPGTQLDTELAAIEETLDETLANLALIQADDGSLATASVGRDQLANDVAMGVGTPTTWATATAYTVRDSVIYSGSWYWCKTAHTSGTFSTDLAALKWEQILNFDSFFSGSITEAQNAATAAQAAQTAAETAQTAAEAAQTAAEAAQAAAELVANNYLDTDGTTATTAPVCDNAATDGLAIGNAAVIGSSGTRAICIGNAYANAADAVAMNIGNNTSAYGAQGAYSFVQGYLNYCAAPRTAVIAGQSNNVDANSENCGLVAADTSDVDYASGCFIGASEGTQFLGVSGSKIWDSAAFGDAAGTFDGSGGASGIFNCVMLATSASYIGQDCFNVVLIGTSTTANGDNNDILIAGPSSSVGTNTNDTALVGSLNVAGGSCNDMSLIGYANSTGNSINQSGAFGGSNYIGASNTDVYLFGDSNVTGSAITGAIAAAIAADIQATANYSASYGYDPFTRLPYATTIGLGALTTGMDRINQRTLVGLLGTTTTATQTEIKINGGSSRITVPAASVIGFRIYIKARRTDAANESAFYILEGAIDNNSGTVALVGAVGKTAYEDTAAWDVTAEADDTNDALVVKVTGEAGKTIEWAADCELYEFITEY